MGRKYRRLKKGSIAPSLVRTELNPFFLGILSIVKNFQYIWPRKCFGSGTPIPPITLFILGDLWWAFCIAKAQIESKTFIREARRKLFSVESHRYEISRQSIAKLYKQNHRRNSPQTRWVMRCMGDGQRIA